MSFFRGKVVVVTGSSNGIGRATARMFAAVGAKVTITGRNAATLAETKAQCIAAGAKENDVLELIGNMNDEEFCAKLVHDTVAKFGQLDVLVNNAGAGNFDMTGKKGLELPVRNYDDIFHLNVRSVIVLSQHAIPHLEKTKGAIVNVSSIASYPFAKSEAYYPMSKAALDQLTVQMAGTLIKKGIRVNAVNPGVIRTNFLASSGVPKEHTDKIIEKYETLIAAKSAVPLGKPGEPEDIAKIIVFLADRSQSEIIIGQKITADGGAVLRNVLAAAFD